MARPTKLTPTVHKAIVESVRKGNYAGTAAEAAGIHKRTFFRWMARGEEHTPEPDEHGEMDESKIPVGEAGFVLLCHDVMRASAEAEAKVVGIVLDAAPTDWRAGTEWLRRKHKERWSTLDKVAGRIDHRHQGTVTHEVEAKMDEDIEDLMKRVATPDSDG